MTEEFLFAVVFLLVQFFKKLADVLSYQLVILKRCVFVLDN